MSFVFIGDTLYNVATIASVNIRTNTINFLMGPPLVVDRVTTEAVVAQIADIRNLNKGDTRERPDLSAAEIKR